MAQVEVQNDAEFVLKHRVVGAVVLILFAVFVLPFILRGQDVNGTSKPATVRSLNEPEPATFVSKVTPVVAGQETQLDASDTGVTVGTLLNKSKESETIDLNTRTQPAPDVSSEAEPDTEKPPQEANNPAKDESAKPEKNLASVDRGWVVQVATFGSMDNANKMKKNLEENGFSVRTSNIDTVNGQATRVWVGPFKQRVDAGRARADIEKAIGQKGLIMAYP